MIYVDMIEGLVILFMLCFLLVGITTKCRYENQDIFEEDPIKRLLIVLDKYLVYRSVDGKQEREVVRQELKHLLRRIKNEK